MKRMYMDPKFSKFIQRLFWDISLNIDLFESLLNSLKGY